MKTLLRILRALLIRLIFMGYMLFCIWRVTFVSENKYYWLMMISVGFLLIETAVLLWLRAGKEFRGILPSVLFFLSCIIPCLWIIYVDEANRKNKFYQIAENQEGKIKDYVMSLDLTSSIVQSINNLNPVPRGFNKTSTTMSATTLKSYLQTSISTTTKSSRHIRSLNTTEPSAFLLALAGMNMSKIRQRIDHTANQDSKPKKESDSDCCDVQVSYSFLEDNLQYLLVQSLMLILVTSRWLITRAELNLNQRSLILVISVATAADILDFFSYLNMEMVYRNNYLLYSSLVIISLSLVQFIFLHIEDSLNLSNSFTNITSMNSQANTDSGSSNNLVNDDDSDEILKNQGNLDPNNKQRKGNQPKFPFSKQYEFIKRHLKADSNLHRPKFTSIYGNFGPHLYDKNLSKNASNPRQSRYEKNKFTKYFCYLFCCCFEQNDPIFFILLAGLFLHDGSYLTFRIFILSKMGWQVCIAQNPALIFYLVKNVFIIITQIYKVYSVTSERRQRRLIDNYRDLVLAAQHENNMGNQNGTNQKINYPPANFLPHSAAIAAAATGGQIPLVPMHAFQNQAQGPSHQQMQQQHQQQQQNYGMNQQFYQPSTANPYRFAQIYADVGGPMSPSKVYNRSLSTLGSANTSFFADANNNNQNQMANNYYKSNTLPNSGQVDQGGYYHQSSTFQSQNSYPQQAFNTPLSESLLAIMNKEYQYKNHLNAFQQQYDQNITMCQTPNSAANMSTPVNPFSAKVGKALYGLPFVSRSKTSIGANGGISNNIYNSSLVNDYNPVNGSGAVNSAYISTFRNSYRPNNIPNGNNSSKIVKSSKI